MDSDGRPIQVSQHASPMLLHQELFWIKFPCCIYTRLLSGTHMAALSGYCTPRNDSSSRHLHKA